MKELSFLQLGLQLLYSVTWVMFLVLIFLPRWAPEKSYQYKSRKFRLSIVLIGIFTGFFALGKVQFGPYSVAVFALFSALTGANVYQKYLRHSSTAKGDDVGSTSEQDKTTTN